MAKKPLQNNFNKLCAIYDTLLNTDLEKDIDLKFGEDFWDRL